MKMIRILTAFAIIFSIYSCGEDVYTVDKFFLRGDANHDGTINIADTARLADIIGGQGQKELCFDAADVNDDGRIDTDDLDYLRDYLFNNGAKPPAPFGVPGWDPSQDNLGPCL